MCKTCEGLNTVVNFLKLKFTCSKWKLSLKYITNVKAQNCIESYIFSTSTWTSKIIIIFFNRSYRLLFYFFLCILTYTLRNTHKNALTLSNVKTVTFQCGHNGNFPPPQNPASRSTGNEVGKIQAACWQWQNYFKSQLYLFIPFA